MLTKFLKSLPNERMIWQSNNIIVNKTDILKTISCINKSYDFHNKKVILCVSNQFLLSHFLVALDGKAYEIIMLPEEISINSDFIRRNSIYPDFIITDSQITLDIKFKNCVILNTEELIKTQNDTDSINFMDNQELKTLWTIATSGTTSTPKLISHTFDSLTRTVKCNIDKGKKFNWALMYKISRFAGLQVFMQSFMSGSKLIFVDITEAPSEIIRQLIISKCNALSATPTMYRKLIIGSDIMNLNLQQITLGGEICDQQLLDTIKKLFTKARVTQVYASTEAGVGFAVNDGIAGFPESYLDDEVNGVKIKVSKNNILFLKNNKTKYINSNTYKIPKDNDGYIDTGDKVNYIDGRYYFLGRSNGAINVGGNKVHPEEVETIIKELKEIKLVSVFGKSNPVLGQIVIAKVVPAVNIQDKDLKSIILRKCKDNLDGYKVPALIKIIEDIPLNQSGKIYRN